MPKISVIMPCFNQEKYVSEAIESVLKQTFSDFELLVVDDGSTDKSVNIINKYKKQDERISLIKQKNSGVIAARTNAINQSRGEYICMLDADDIIAPNALEQMYNAIIQKRGDIITSRVMRFGCESGEMILKKPNKINMSVDNCLVNAALFRKSDFIKCGGFDNRFTIALEDYDLWLNLLFNHNKHIYRIPKILFYYRIKPHDESRNFQNREKHKQLVQILKGKYPLQKWHTIRNIILWPKKLKNMIFNIKNGVLYVFHIPVIKLRKYDCVISIGAACFVPDALKSLKLRDFSGPFDWMFGSDVITRLKIVHNRFKNYFDFNDFEFVGENPDNGKMIYKNNRTGIIYNHDFPRGKFKDIFPDIAEKYARRITRTLKHLDSDERVLFVFSELGQTGNIDKIVQIMDKINTKYRANIDLLYINHNPDIKLGKHTKLKKMSTHVFYTEYHYDKFPDELGQARKTCKKMIAKVAK